MRNTILLKKKYGVEIKNWNIVVLGGYKERNIHTDRHHIEIIKKNFLPSFKHNRNFFVVVEGVVMFVDIIFLK